MRPRAQKTQRILLGLSLLALAGILAACRTHAPKTALSPSQTIINFSLIQTDMAGKLWTLDAEQAYIMGEETAQLESPKIVFYKNAKPSTQAVSLYGTAGLKTQDIELSSSVVVHSLEDQTVLQTEKLYYTSKTKKIHTDFPVVLTKPDGVMKGVGLEANSDLSDMHVFHQKTDMAKQPD